jgi:hypothetical protein
VLYRSPRVLRWLTRLLRPERTETEGAPTAAAPAPQPEVIALATAEPSAVAVPAESVPVAVAEAKETCPDCGRTSVFAGPPGHRYCMHCALRQELFDSKTASN